MVKVVKNFGARVMDEDRRVFEASLKALHEAGEHEQLLTRALERYGARLAGFQLKMLDHNHSLAEEAWSMFLEDAWKGLPRFQWRAQLKTWLFSLARNAVCRLRRQPHMRIRSTTYSPSLAQAALRPFTTAIGLETAADQLHRYFVRLSEDDQWICALRVGCRLSWKQVAQVVNDWDAAPDEKSLVTESNRIRNRFNRMQKRMREWAQEDGLRLRDDV